MSMDGPPGNAIDMRLTHGHGRLSGKSYRMMRRAMMFEKPGAFIHAAEQIDGDANCGYSLGLEGNRPSPEKDNFESLILNFELKVSPRPKRCGRPSIFTRPSLLSFVPFASVVRRSLHRPSVLPRGRKESSPGARGGWTMIFFKP